MEENIPFKKYIIIRNTYFDSPTLDILLTVSNFATTCQLAVNYSIVDCLFNIF